MKVLSKVLRGNQFYNVKNKSFGIIWVPCASVSKRVLVQNFSYENDFDLHENKLGVGKYVTLFHHSSPFSNETGIHSGTGE